MTRLAAIRERVHQSFRDSLPDEYPSDQSTVVLALRAFNWFKTNPPTDLERAMHMMREMNITAKRDEVLAKLRENRKTHATIVAEAREGYVTKARAALEKRLAQIREGKIVSLVFELRPPVDHTKTYDLAIQMLELHQGEQIELTADQVKQLVMDDWDWTENFLVSNRGYSQRAAEMYDAR